MDIREHERHRLHLRIRAEGMDIRTLASGPA